MLSKIIPKIHKPYDVDKTSLASDGAGREVDEVGNIGEKMVAVGMRLFDYSSESKLFTEMVRAF